MTTPKNPRDVHSQVSVVAIVPGAIYEVRLRFEFPDGRCEVLSAGSYASKELAIKRAMEVQDELARKGGKPTAGVS